MEVPGEVEVADVALFVVDVEVVAVELHGKEGSGSWLMPFPPVSFSLKNP